MQVFGPSLSTWDSFECHIEDSITYAIAVLVAVDDHCFHSCWKFLVNQTQVLLNLLVLMYIGSISDITSFGLGS